MKSFKFFLWLLVLFLSLNLPCFAAHYSEVEVDGDNVVVIKHSNSTSDGTSIVIYDLASGSEKTIASLAGIPRMMDYSSCQAYGGLEFDVDAADPNCANECTGKKFNSISLGGNYIAFNKVEGSVTCELLMRINEAGDPYSYSNYSNISDDNTTILYDMNTGTSAEVSQISNAYTPFKTDGEYLCDTQGQWVECFSIASILDGTYTQITFEDTDTSGVERIDAISPVEGKVFYNNRTDGTHYYDLVAGTDADTDTTDPYADTYSIHDLNTDTVGNNVYGLSVYTGLDELYLYDLEANSTTTISGLAKLIDADISGKITLSTSGGMNVTPRVAYIQESGGTYAVIIWDNGSETTIHSNSRAKNDANIDGDNVIYLLEATSGDYKVMHYDLNTGTRTRILR